MSLFNTRIKKKQTQSFSAQRRNILNNKTSFYVRESYNSLRTNVRFFQAGQNCKRFCVTSAVAGEGKSITILNMAIAFAEDGQRVLLIDADMRRPSQGRLLIECASPGLSNLLADQCDVQEVIRENVYPNMDVIFSGDIPPNPSELLGSPRMEELIEQLSKNYDYILVDSPPAGIVTDACLIGKVLDGAVFLVRQNKTQKDILARSVKQLENAGVRMMGFVINGYIANSNHIHRQEYRAEETRKKLF